MTVSKLDTELVALLEPLLEAAGYELVELERGGSGTKPVLRVVLDRLEGREPISIEDCVRASRLIEPALDAADPITDAYSLEVSSPGVERPLRRPRDFARFVGERAMLVIIDDAGARQSVSGRLLEPDADGVSVESQGEVTRYRFEEIERAKLEFTFGGASAKPGGKGSTKGSKKRR